MKTKITKREIDGVIYRVTELPRTKRLELMTLLKKTTKFANVMSKPKGERTPEEAIEALLAIPVQAVIAIFRPHITGNGKPLLSPLRLDPDSAARLFAFCVTATFGDFDQGLEWLRANPAH